MALLGRLNDAGITVILVTHDQSVAGFARRVISLKDGYIVDDRSQDGARHALDRHVRLRPVQA